MIKTMMFYRVVLSFLILLGGIHQTNYAQAALICQIWQKVNHADTVQKSQTKRLVEEMASWLSDWSGTRLQNEGYGKVLEQVYEVLNVHGFSQVKVAGVILAHRKAKGSYTADSYHSVELLLHSAGFSLRQIQLIMNLWNL